MSRPDAGEVFLPRERYSGLWSHDVKWPASVVSDSHLGRMNGANLMTLRRLSLVAGCVLCLGTLWADDFKSLRKEYEDAKGKAGGAPRDRAGKVQKSISPILEKIGALDSAESLAFLLGELKAALSEIGAACAGPILAHTSENAPKALIAAFTDKNKPVAIGILTAFAKTKRDLKSYDSDLVRLGQGVQDIEVRKALPPVLGLLDTVPAAKVILGGVQAGKQVKGEDHQAAYNAAAAAALKAAKSDDVKKWLTKDAFHAAGSDAAKLAVVARAAGELKLADARPELEKLVNNSSSEVSAAAVAGLSQIGLGGSTEDIAAALEKNKSKGSAGFKIQALDSLAQSNTDEALEVVLKNAQGSDAELRAIAMGSLSIFKEKPRAIEGLCKGLEDSNPSVRATALRALILKRDKAMIGPLIEVVGREKEEERLKVQAAEVLARLTGQGQIGLQYEDWKKWWDVAQAKFEFPKDADKAVTGVRVQNQLSYFGIEVSSKHVGFLIDISGSMEELVPVKEGGKGSSTASDREKPEGKTTVGGAGGGPGSDPKIPVKDGKAKKIDVLKKELASLLRRLPADMQINILTFYSTFDQWQPELQPLAGPGRQKAIKFVQDLKTKHGTNVFDTLEAALKDKRVDTIYLLTDGLPSAGRILDQAGICKEIQAQNRLRGVTIHCVAFGEEAPLLEQLAKENGGKYRFVNSY